MNDITTYLSTQQRCLPDDHKINRLFQSTATFEMSTTVQKRELSEVIDETEVTITSKRTKLGETSEKQNDVILRDIQLIQDKRLANKVGSDGLSQCFHRVRAAMYVSIAPCFVNDPLSAIRQQHLDPMLMSYCPALRGVVISYFRLKIMDQSQMEDELSGRMIALGRVGNDTPFSFLWCTVDFLLWSPKIGDVVEGWCYMQSQSHIGLLIHDAFNATIKKFNIPAEWQFVPNEEDEYHDADAVEDGGLAESKNAGDATTEGTDTTQKIVSDPSRKQDRHGGRFGHSLGHWIDENGIPIQGKLQFRIRAMHLAGRAISIEGTLVLPQDERDTQPVTLKDSKSTSSKKHMRFDDEPAAVSKDTDLNKAEKSDAEESSSDESSVEDNSSSDEDDDDKDEKDDDKKDKQSSGSPDSSASSASSDESSDSSSDDSSD